MQNGNELTHVAYADESHHNIGRYRAIALVTLPLGGAADQQSKLQSVLESAGVFGEFKWQKLKGQANYRAAASGMVQYAIEQTRCGQLRIDVLTWDIEDRRHAVRGRDDSANLQRMYYHVFDDVLSKRWPSRSRWHLCPDENSAIDWETLETFLDNAGTRFEGRKDLLTQGKLLFNLRTLFGIHRITPSQSHEQPLIQLADLFAGLGVLSRVKHTQYLRWLADAKPQQPLFPELKEPPLDLTNSERARFEVIDELDRRCKTHRMGVSVRKYGGLRTPDPTNPINFWWYTPQHDLDKAPLKGES